MRKIVKLTPYKRDELKVKMMEFRTEAEDGNKAAFKRMTENERMKIGLQWDDADLSYNEAHGKFSLTVNEILPIILDIAGTQEENPMDIRIRPVKGGAQIIADMLSALIKKTMDLSHGIEEASRTFESGVTSGRGFLGILIDNYHDPEVGDLRVSELDPFMVLPDPTCKVYNYNAQKNGAKYIWVDEWEDKEKIEATYPGRKQHIKDATYDMIPQGRFRGIMSRIFGGAGPNLSLRDDYRYLDDQSYTEEMEYHVPKALYNYRVSTCWWREWITGVYLVKVADPLNRIALTNKGDIKKAKKVAEMKPDVFKIIDKDRNELPLTIPRLNMTQMIGDELLMHIEDPFDGMNLYPVIRFAPFFDHGYEYPPVENLKGPQKLLNFTFSALANILKNLANSGWKTGKTTEKWREWLEEHGSKDGVVIPLDKFSNTVEKIEPNQYPTGFDVITERSKQNMRETAQVQLEVPVRRAESGRALAIREQQSLKTKGIPFRNWKQTNLILGETISELITSTNLYSDDEILATVDEDEILSAKILDQARSIVLRQIRQAGHQIPGPPEPPNPVRLRNGTPNVQAAMIDAFQKEQKVYAQFAEQVEQAAIPIARDLTLKLLRNKGIGRYGTKVDLAPFSATLRMAQRMESLELDERLLAGGRPGLSRDMLIDLSDLPNKDRAKAEGQQLALQGQVQ